MMKAVFLDREGTINVGVPVYDRVDNLNKVEMLPNSMEALKQLNGLCYGVFIITNQAGLAEGLITQAQFDVDIPNSWMIGDRPSDVMAGVNAGTRTILVKTGVPTVECDQATVTVPSLLEAIQYIADHQA